jgi:2,4-dienoyl-CoA reductase-like NADH-dependent reductase (Old Yellow Enzyme family)
VPALARLTAAVHQNGGRIFCELSHAGSQSVMPNIDPIAPSIIENAIFERQPREMSANDIERIIAAFGQAARRASAAGFDGIHIHGGNGYLISQFNSPFSNRRSDQWGGDAYRRSRFFLAVYDAIRAAVGPDMPITARYGLADSGPGRLQLDEGLARLRVLAACGLNAVEPTYGLMTTYLVDIVPHTPKSPMDTGINANTGCAAGVRGPKVVPMLTPHVRTWTRACCPQSIDPGRQRHTGPCQRAWHSVVRLH